MSKRYEKPPQRAEFTLHEIPLPKEYQRKQVALLLESAFARGPDELMVALRNCVEDTDAGKRAQADSKESSETMGAMLARFHDIHGKTALHYACLGRRTQNVEFILNLCPAIAPLKDSEGDTALMLACLTGEGTLVNAVLHHDRDVNAKNQAGVTALHYAAASGSTDSIEALVEAGAEVNCYSELSGTPLLYAVMSNHWDATELLLRRKADPNYPFNVQRSERLNFPPPLLYACSAREDSIAELLLANNADPNIRDKDSWTALHCAAEAGAFRAVQSLLQANADAGVITEGMTAFDLAMQHHNWAIADLLKNRTPVLQGADYATWLTGLKAAYTKRFQADQEAKRQAAAALKDENVLRRIDEAMTLKTQGDAYNEAGDCGLAATKYTEALKALPASPAANKERAALFASRSMMYLSIGDIVAAEDDANKATELDPLWSKGFSTKARVYRAKGQWKEYTKCLYEALTRQDVRDEELIAELKHAIQLTVQEEEAVLKSKTRV